MCTLEERTHIKPFSPPTHTHTHTHTYVELNLVDVLYQMLKDKDAQVVTNCISALNEILASEGGMVVNTKIAHYLLNR